MSVLYDFMPLPSKENDENAPRLYPKLIPYQTVSFNELHWATQLLSEGRRVQIGNIGTLSVSLKADTEVYDKSEVHAQSIRFNKVKMTVSKQFSKQCYGRVLRAPLEKKVKQSSSAYSEEERLAMLQSYLETHDYITRTEYGNLTGLLKYKAWQDLNKWVDAKLIDIAGRAPHRVYVRRKE